MTAQSMEDLAAIERKTISRIKRARKLESLDKVRHEVLGKKGVLGLALRNLGSLPADERPKAGAEINEVKVRISEVLDAAVSKLEEAAQKKELEKTAYDVTLPGRRLRPGAKHPLRMVEDEVIQCLRSVGFSVADGPLVEHDWYNFGALNFPPEHPARDMQDTFFVSDEVLLRTHTSNVQIRTMAKQKPPVKILAPGMVFRKDEVDATHSPVFHQIEGLWIDERATFADLKGVLRWLAQNLFGSDTRVQFRPSFFPFTEPSLEMDVNSPAFGDRWLEILGAGMVHPNVLESVGYDPETCQGFAFGMGVERIAMLRWGVDDIRLFYEGDQRFLEQFNSQAGRH